MSALELPPDLRSRLRRLSLRPRRAAAGTGFGLHAGRVRGAGTEFAQYRTYQQGDDVRRIDWRLYARSDHVFIRDAERESPAALWIVVDASASMSQADQDRPQWSRLDGAKRLAAALLEVAVRDGDRFGLVSVGADGARASRLEAGARHRDRLLGELAGLTPQGVAAWSGAFDRAAERFSREAIIAVLSDGFDEACVAAVERQARAGRDVALVQLLTADERDFPFHGGAVFEDPESGRRVLGHGPAMRAAFLSRFAEARTAQAARLRASGARRVEHFLDESADQPIRTLFQPGRER